MRQPEDIISTQQILKVHGNANFGPRADRDVVNEAVLKIACGYSNGSTANTILVEHGLITKRPMSYRGKLTVKGQRYLWAVYGKEIP